MSSFFQWLCASCIHERFFFPLAKNLLSLFVKETRHICASQICREIMGLHNRPSVCGGSGPLASELKEKLLVGL